MNKKCKWINKKNHNEDTVRMAFLFVSPVNVLTSYSTASGW